MTEKNDRNLELALHEQVRQTARTKPNLTEGGHP
jgi:hypothetical protein